MRRAARLMTIAAVLSIGPLVWPARAAAQLHQSLCADCHFANLGKPDPMHLQEWDASAHGRAGVGCEKCHGGNPDTVESFPAHQSIVRGHGPDTPVHPSRLPHTCGTCHTGPAAQFQKSRHAKLLEHGDYRGPTCSTCHGNAAAYLLSPRALEIECNSCHGRGKPVQRPEYAADARALLQNTRDVRTLLDSARPIVRRTKDAALRASLEYDYDQAQVPLTEAVHDGHAFVFTDARERLGVARARAEALLERLANRRDR
jgi:cytochrome c7-like protein/cytochrome c554/c'-like protein